MNVTNCPAGSFTDELLRDCKSQDCVCTESVALFIVLTLLSLSGIVVECVIMIAFMIRRIKKSKAQQLSPRLASNNLENKSRQSVFSWMLVLVMFKTVFSCVAFACATFNIANFSNGLFLTLLGCALIPHYLSFVITVRKMREIGVKAIPIARQLVSVASPNSIFHTTSGSPPTHNPPLSMRWIKYLTKLADFLEFSYILSGIAMGFVAIIFGQTAPGEEVGVTVVFALMATNFIASLFFPLMSELNLQALKTIAGIHQNVKITNTIRTIRRDQVIAFFGVTLMSSVVILIVIGFRQYWICLLTFAVTNASVAAQKAVYLISSRSRDRLRVKVDRQHQAEHQALQAEDGNEIQEYLRSLQTTIMFTNIRDESNTETVVPQDA